MAKNKTVIVIGGGVAGLAAAAMLVKQCNWEVTLLEASDRIGGRVHTKEFGSGMVEIGAEWIHGQTGNSVYEAVTSAASNLLNTANISDDKFWSDVGYIYATQHGVKLDKSLNTAITQFMNIMEEDPRHFATDRLLSKSEVAVKYTKAVGPIWTDKRISNAAMNWIERYWNSYDCADSWEEVSYAGTTLDYVELPGIRNIAWNAPANSTTFLKVILEGASFDAKSRLMLPEWIQLKKEVTNINYSDSEKVTVECGDGTKYKADYVICTIPLGVLKRNHSALFHPKLAGSKLRAIENIGFGTVNKLYFEFDAAWWPPEFNGVNLLWDEPTLKNNSGHMSSAELLEERNGFPMWCRGLLNFHTVESYPRALRSWLTGRAARVVEALSDKDVKTACMKVLRQFMGPDYEIPEPIEFMATKWSSNPFSGGTYSLRTISSERENVWASNLAEPIRNPNGTPIVCFAGEATDTNFYSSLHGAYSSGLREANRLIEWNSANQN